MNSAYGSNAVPMMFQLHLTVNFLLGFVYYLLPDIFSYKRLVKQHYKQIMVLAHPDDETLFFSHVLLSEKRDVVVFCLTNGYDFTRRKEFYKAMRYYDVQGYMLKIPDRTVFSFLFNNKNVKKIIRNIKRDFPSCDTVYTHNQEGEYGHRHHVIVSRSVADEFSDKVIVVPISCSAIGDDAFLLSGNVMAHKQFVFNNCYASQAKDVKQNLPEWFFHEQTVCFITKMVK